MEAALNETLPPVAAMRARPGNCETGAGTRGTGYAPGDVGAAGDPTWRPVLPRLAALADAHPRLTFNLAVSLRVYADPVDPCGEHRVISDCHFSVQRNHFIPGFLSNSVAVF